jgi:hypothetical protein
MAGSAIRGYHPTYLFAFNGVISTIVNGVAGTLTAGSTFGGFCEINVDSFIKTMTLREGVAGAAGTTTVEVFRVRGGTPTSLGTISVASGAGNFGTASTVPASAALQNLLAGDYLAVQVNAKQTTVAADISVSILFQ